MVKTGTVVGAFKGEICGPARITGKHSIKVIQLTKEVKDDILGGSLLWQSVNGTRSFAGSTAFVSLFSLGVLLSSV